MNMTVRRIVIISEIYYPEETSTSYILTHIAEALADEYEVMVLCGPSDYTGTLIEAPKTEKHNNVDITRCNIPRISKNKIISRVIRSLILSIFITIKAFLKITKGDIVFVVTNPFTIVFFMSLICKIKKADLVMLVHDVFPDNLMAANILEDHSYIYFLLDKLSMYSFRQATSIIVLGRDMRTLLEKKINNVPIPIKVIGNWADINEIEPVNKNETALSRKLNFIDKFIVLFAGNIGRVQGIEFLVEAAEKTKSENVHFVFVGNGAYLPYLKELVRNKEIINVSFLGHLPRAEQNCFLNTCDVGIVSLAPGMLGLGVPSKTYNIMAAGKPIIAMVESDSEIGLLVREEQVGWVVTPGDAEGLVEAIREARDNPGLLNFMGNRARKAAVTKYSPANILDAYKIHFRGLGNSRRMG